MGWSYTRVEVFPDRVVFYPTSYVRMGNLLIVDDDVLVRRAITKCLERSGEFVITEVGDSAAAVQCLKDNVYDLVLCDVHLPGMSGIELLRYIRGYDLDVPVILMTGQATVSTAIEALELGAYSYIEKPTEPTLFLNTVRRAVKLANLAQAKRELACLGMGSPLPGDRAGLEAMFKRALDGLRLAYQPIFEAASGNLAGYEALMRTTESPAAVLEAAERLGHTWNLGRRIRDIAAGSNAPLLFVNLHPSELSDPHLYDPRSQLTQVASRVVLEITERSTIEGVHDIAQRVKDLRELGFRIAVDDLGAGYSGLTSFATLEPEFVKLDMSLIRRIESSPIKARLVSGVVGICRDLGMKVIAEGVETGDERSKLITLGCDYLQGYLLGRPSLV